MTSAGQHVRRELQAGEFHAQAGGQGFDGQGFGQAGHAFEQHVAIGEQANDQSFDQIALADDDFSDFAEQRPDEGAGSCTASLMALIPVFIVFESEFYCPMDKKTRKSVQINRIKFVRICLWTAHSRRSKVNTVFLQGAHL